MTDASDNIGFVLICDQDGIVRTVAVPSQLVTRADLIGESVLRIFDVRNIDKALRFLVELRTRGSVFAWELNVMRGNAIATMRFTGVRDRDDLIIFGAPDDDQLMCLYDEMSRINNEQIATLRTLLQEQAQQKNVRAAYEADSYAELMKLNNELVTLQRELARQNRELEQINAQKNKFLGMAAHDLRNPLGIIQAYSEFLLSDLPADVTPQQIEFVQEIRQLSEFMLGMVNDLLDIAAINADKVNLTLEPVNLSALMARNLKLNRVLAGRKQIDLTLACSHQPPLVRADAGKLHQVLNNLLSNAIKFSLPHTTVTVWCTVINTEVAISVTDQGPGIPADEITKLFRPFARTSVQSTAGEKSTGLGLMISKQIVESHGGRIWAESEVGRGTTFTFTLPRAADLEGEPQPDDACKVETQHHQTDRAPVESNQRTIRPGAAVTLSTPAPTARVPASDGRARILLVEDDVLNQKVMRYLLNSMGHTADMAENGVSAVAAVKDRPYDLVLMDMHMPEMDGPAASRQIRALPLERQPHIFAVSAAITPDERQACLDAGMEGFLSKPAQREELASVLQRVGLT